MLIETGRNLLGGVFPLVTNAMFTNLGYPGASSLLGGIVRCTCERLSPSILTGTGPSSDPSTVGPCVLRRSNPREEQACKCKFRIHGRRSIKLTELGTCSLEKKMDG